jgi:hypothetical protein
MSIRRLLLLSLLLTGAILMVGTVSASTLAGQLDDSSSETGVSGYGQALGANISGDLMFIKIKYVSGCTDLYRGKPYRRIGLYIGNSNAASFGGFEQNGDFCTFKRLDNTDNFIDFPITLTSGNDYYFVVGQNGLNQEYIFFGSEDANSYSDGNIVRFYSWGWQEGSGLLKDLYFELLGPNEEPIISNLSQRISQIEEGSTNAGSAILGAYAISQLGKDMKLQVELKPVDTPFTGDEGGIIEGNFGQSFTRIYAEVLNLSEGQYHWRARVIDADGNTSEWFEYDAPSDTDFTIEKITQIPKNTFIKQTDYSSFEIKETPMGQNLGSNISGEVLYIGVRYDSSCTDVRYGPYRIITIYDETNDVANFGGFEKRGDMCLFKRLDQNLKTFIDTPYSLTLGHDYTFFIGQNGPAETHTFFGSDDPNSYEGGTTARFFSNGWQEGNGKLEDLYFELRGPEQNSGQNLEPVIIVPGIMGSRLNRVSDGEEVWPNVDLMSFSNDDGYLSSLILNDFGGQIRGLEMKSPSVTDVEEIVIGDITIKRVGYGNLINNFINQGYASGTDLFTVPYDWRLSLEDEVDRLNDVVQTAISNSPSGKVSIIAHSMGGLLVKEYLNNLPDTSFVDKLILAGVPQLGAPKAFKALNYGDNMGFEFAGKDVLNSDRIKTISQNMPGIYELLPSRKYIDVNGGYVKDFRSEVKILNYDETAQLMKDNGRNGSLIDVADDFHQEIDNSQFNAQNVYNIVGCRQTKTIGGFNIYDDEVKIVLTNGDGTVPLSSAFNLASGYNNYFVLNNETDINHTGLIRDEKTLALINNIISNQSDIAPEGISTNTSDCTDEFGWKDLIKSFVFGVHSPVELHLYDSYGNHLGPNSNGDIELEIPGGSYEVIGEDKFAIVPATDVYDVAINAISTGKFGLEVENYAGTTKEEKITYLDIPLQTNNAIAKLTFTNTNGDLALKLDNEGDGIIDMLIQPNAVLDSNTAGDITPPEISFNMQNTVILNSKVAMSFTVTDDLSGVGIIESDLDGTQVNKGATVKISNIGNHTLTVKTVDKAGNPRIAKFTFSAVYNFGGFLPPINPDGSGIYKLGRTIPIKFQITDANGKFISTANPTLTLKKISNCILRGKEIPLSDSVTNGDNKFRYDIKSNQYIYNLSTKTMSKGAWRLKVTLNDGKSYEVDVSLSK